MADDQDGYRVGYGRPPLHTRFKKGQSGNPNGRRRKTTRRNSAHNDLTSFRRTILEEASRLIRVKENGQVTEMTQEQAVVRAIIASAASGRPLAQRTALEMFMHVQDKQAAGRKSCFEGWLEYVATWRAAEAARKQRGLPPPDCLPHPEDLVFNYEQKTVRCDGPTNETLWAFQQLTDWRELMLALDVEADHGAAAKEEDGEVSIFLLSTHLLDSLQPPRLRWSQSEWVRSVDRIWVMRRRERRQLIDRLCHRLDLDPELIVVLADAPPSITRSKLGFRLVDGSWIIERGWSFKKFRKRLWADFPFQKCSPERIELMRRIGVPVPREF